MKVRRIAALASLALVVVQPAWADVTLPTVFSDHMVLQANLAAPIFGSAAPGEQLTIEFDVQKKTVTAGQDGKWLVRLDPVKPGGPFTLKVSGKNSLTL